MNTLRQEISFLIDSSQSIFSNYLKSRKEKILEIPKLAFLSLYKNSTIRETRYLGSIFSTGLIKLASQGEYISSIYLNCYKNKFVTYTNHPIEKTDLLISFLTNRNSFDLDSFYDKFKSSSLEELNDNVFEITGCKRKNSEETAINYFSGILNKIERAKFILTYEDLKIHIGSNKILNDYLKSEEDFQKIKNEVIVRTATKLLGSKI